MNAHAMYNSIGNSDPEDLVVSNAKLVKRIAFHLMNRLPPSVQAEDLIQAGMIGLIDAAKNYDATQGASFETYAGIRVRGAMLDEIRRSDWTPRSVHRKSREAAEVVRKFEQETGRDANDNEVAEELGISISAFHQILTESTTAHVFSFDQPDEQTGEPISMPKSDEITPMENMVTDSFQDALAKCIKGLPERECLVMSLYYDEDLNLREIGEILGVSESRVCQIHGQALVRLRARLSEWTQPDDM